MRRLRFIPALLVILSACSEQLIEQRPLPSEEVGTVSIALSTDMRNEIIGTRADADEPVLDDFRVAIYKLQDDKMIRLYNDSYANTVGQEIKLNAAMYRLVAHHGDTLGCGFNKAYYLAEKEFEVKKGSNTVSAEAKLANVKMAVNYHETIKENYSDYYTIVRHNDHEGKQIKFSKNETRCGYMPGGEVVLEVYAVVDEEGTVKYFKTEPMTYSPNDFVTFTITTDNREGSLVINITVDTATEDKNETIEIPATTVPQAAPTITLAGFDGADNTHEIIEGQTAAGHSGMASFIARGSLSHCYLTTDSDWLAAKGVPAEVDFANLDSNTKALLKSAGFSWDEGMATSRTFSFIDFSDVIANMLSSVKAGADDVTMADFSLKVVDAVGKEITEQFSIVSGGVKVSLDIKDYNVWAAKVVDPVVTISKGVPALVDFQVTSDGVSWSDIEVTPSTSGYTLNYGTIPTAPSTTYQVRAIYNKNENCKSPVVTITTEDALQLGNSGFEDYQLVTKRVSPLGSSYNRNWYLPYASGETDPWWACNSLQSMPDGHTLLTATWCKNFPSSGYVDDRHSGNKAAMLFTVNVGSANTGYNNNTIGVASGTTYEGEIWIGTSDSDGNHATEGHAFASRPSRLTFYYKYAPTDGDKFFVDAWVKAADGTVLATAQETAGPAADTWTLYSLPFTYKVFDKKAASIYVRFSSCYGDGHVDTDSKFRLGEETVKAHAGSFLKLDDIELIYE